MLKLNLLRTACLGLALTAFLPALAHAADDERLSRMEDELHALQSRGGGATAAGNALSDQRLDTLESQVRDLTGQLERSQYQNAQLRNQLERMSGDIDLRFDQLRQQPPTAVPNSAPTSGPTSAPAAAPATAPATPGMIDNSNTGVGTNDGDEPQANAAQASGNPKTTAAAAAANPQATYDDAFGKLRAADYAGAAAGFTAFLKANPQNALAGNAQYWLGETYYVRGQYKEAAVAFAEGYQKYPKNAKAPDNLLKLAMSLDQLNSKSDACLTLGELKKNYPTAAATVKARADQERAKLACK